LTLGLINDKVVEWSATRFLLEPSASTLAALIVIRGRTRGIRWSLRSRALGGTSGRGGGRHGSFTCSKITVVRSARLVIGKNIGGKLDGLEGLGGVGVRVDIRMPLACKLAVRFLDVLLRSVPSNA
jgi:hypothetical protein